MTRGRILVIDDDFVSRRLAALLLADEGCAVTEAVDAHDGLAKLRDHPFAIVLMDLSMPGMSGIEAVRRLRAFRPATYVIGYTAHALPGDCVRMREAGFDEVLVKPVGGEALGQAIRRGLARAAPPPP